MSINNQIKVRSLIFEDDRKRNALRREAVWRRIYDTLDLSLNPAQGSHLANGLRPNPL